MRKILIGTTNKKKILEIQKLLEDFASLEILDLSSLGIYQKPEETGKSFEENAKIKACFYSKLTGLPAIADDSGLEVYALNNAPGVYSSRYAGECGNDMANINKLLKELKGVPWEKRGARFVCVICMAYLDEIILNVRGECEGYITESLRGMNGFGYDPVFWSPSAKKTFAELSIEEKNRISHRGIALRMFKKELEKRLKSGSF